MQGRLLLAMCIASSLFGCSDQPEVLIDTTGAHFDWRCSARGGCKFGLLAETPAPVPCPEDYGAAYSYLTHRFVEIVSVCEFPDGSGWSSSPDHARYLICEADDDCPQFHFSEYSDLYECSAGLCQNVDVDEHPRDTIMHFEAIPLCLADTPRGYGGYNEIEALLDAHCGPESRDLCALPLPEPCWQP
jgi:hypothetical protein